MFHGDVLHLRDVITFQGDTPTETEAAFRDSVDDYLEWCAELGQAPEAPTAEPLKLEVAPDERRRLARVAERAGKPLDEWERGTLLAAAK